MRKMLFAFAALFFVSQLFAQTNSPKALKPGDTIPLIVKFSRKLPPGSKVSVTYSLFRGLRGADCRTQGGFGDSEQSKDNQNFYLAVTLSSSIISGTYKFDSLTVSSPGLTEARTTTAEDAPIFTVENPCLPKVKIPPFKVGIK